MKKIKILQIMGGLQSGGVEAVIYNYFANMDKELFEIHILYHGEPVKECEEKFIKLGCVLHQVTTKKENIRKSISETYKIMKDNKFDIVHANMSIMCFFYLFIARICNIKVRIAHSHLVEFPKGLIKKIGYTICKLFNRITANYYFACSEDAAVFIFGKRNVKKGKVHIMKNAIEIKQFSFSKEIRKDLRMELGLDNKFVIGNVGRFTDQKNQDFIIEIFYELVQKYQDMELILIGVGPDEEKIKNKVKYYKIEDKVHFLGIRNDIYRYYQGMDLFLFPSTYEGLGIVLIEAQISGLMCITSDIVPRETQITDLIEYVSLKSNKSIWEEKIISNRDKIKTTNRNSYTDEATKYGYDIKVEAKKLQAKYINMVEGI